ncbi:hypothetical protein DMENIID0001_105130 [Sergentomyia squamirostris]
MKRSKTKIESVTLLNKSENNPILAKFQNGDLEIGPVENLECHLATEKKNKKVRKLITACDASVYIGNVERDPQMNTFIAIRNAVTNKMRLVQVEKCSLLSEHVLDVKEYSVVRTTTDEGTRSLATQFGGKKAIRAQDKFNRMKVNVDIVKDHLDSMIETHNESVKDEPNIPDFNESPDCPIVPPMNLNAKTIKELYSITEILTPHLIRELESVAVEVVKTPIDQIPIESNFLLDKLRKIQASSNPNSEENLLKVKALIYLDALINLTWKVNLKVNLSQMSFSEICDNVEMDIRKKFCDPKTTKQIKTKFTERKAISHILILAILLTDKLEISIEEMVLELKKVSKKEIMEYGAYLGLKVSGKNFLGLKMPSDMDKNRHMRPTLKRRRK